MEQKRIANVLNLFSVAVAVVGALFFFWYLPHMIQNWIDTVAQGAPGWLYRVLVARTWLIAVLCYLALWKFWQICNRIGADNSFCRENARAMRFISLLAFLAAGVILGADVWLYFAGVLGKTQAVGHFFIIFAACGLGVVALALSQLILNAALLKGENDLTI